MILKLRGSHGLADFLNDTFALVPSIWKRALPVSLASLAPGIALWIAAIGSLVGLFRGIVADGETFAHEPSAVFSSLMPFIWLCILASIALYLGGSYQKAFVCAQAGAAIEGREPRLVDLINSTARPAFIRVAVQDAVIGALSSFLALGIIGILFFPLLIGKMGDLLKLGERGGPNIGAIVLVAAAYLVSILIAAAASWWLTVKTAVSAPVAVIERVNSFAGLGRSLDLVRGRGWRVFGVMFIVSLVISFGLGILTGPITFAVILPGYFSFLKETIAGNSPSPDSIVAFLSSMSWALGLTMLISGVIQGSLWPSFLTLLHADLRIRAGELEPMIENLPASAGYPTAEEKGDAPIA
jgi:hypothetical protein